MLCRHLNNQVFECLHARIWIQFRKKKQSRILIFSFFLYQILVLLLLDYNIFFLSFPGLHVCMRTIRIRVFQWATNMLIDCMQEFIVFMCVFVYLISFWNMLLLLLLLFTLVYSVLLGIWGRLVACYHGIMHFEQLLYLLVPMKIYFISKSLSSFDTHISHQ